MDNQNQASSSPAPAAPVAAPAKATRTAKNLLDLSGRPKAEPGQAFVEAGKLGLGIGTTLAEALKLLNTALANAKANKLTHVRGTVYFGTMETKGE